MRTMTRNRQTFYEAAHATRTMGVDTDGNYTEPMTTYDEVRAHEGVITPASGTATTQLFGMNEIYDKVITLNQGENYLAVGSVLWVDTMPTFDGEGRVTNAHDYVVVRVSPSLNFVNVAIKKVNVTQ